MSLLTLYTAPSGLFCPIPNSYEHGNSVSDSLMFNNAVYNPGVLDHHRGSYESFLNESKITTFLEKSTGDKKWELDDDHINSYAETIVKLSEAVIASNATCRLAPLRGAARPCMLLQVMSRGEVEFEPFNFRQGSSGTRNLEITKELEKILHGRDTGKEVYTIQIVDTAIGGHGIVALVNLLRDLHDENFAFKKQFWVIDIHLLHPSNGHENISKMESVKGLSDNRFQVMLNRYEVPDLIVEDYDEALGFTLEREGSFYVMKPSVVGGRFLLKANGVYSLIESEDLSRTFDELLCDALTCALTTDPNRELVKIVWQEYTSKG